MTVEDLIQELQRFPGDAETLVNYVGTAPARKEGGIVAYVFFDQDEAEWVDYGETPPATLVKQIKELRSRIESAFWQIHALTSSQEEAKRALHLLDEVTWQQHARRWRHWCLTVGPARYIKSFVISMADGRKRYNDWPCFFMRGKHNGPLVT